MGPQVSYPALVTLPSEDSRDRQLSWLGTQLQGVLLLLITFTVICETLELGLVKRLSRS